MRNVRAVLVAVAGLLVLVPTAAAHASPAPVLGDWEGTGPEGLPLSFVLARVHGKVTISDMTIGNPLRCAGHLLPTDATPVPKAVYIGPGAPPFVRLGWHSSEIWIETGTGLFGPQVTGRLLSPRRAVLSELAPGNQPPGCGWSQHRLTWHVSPAHRAAVTPGVWTGTVVAPGVGGTVSVHVSPSGRIVELFRVELTCEAGGGHYQVGPDAQVGEFISASGAFSDPGRPAAFQGSFAAGTLTGTLNPAATGCGQTAVPFTAHPG